MAEEDAKLDASKCRCDVRCRDDVEKKNIQQEI
jgi:hypothetical protein